MFRICCQEKKKDIKLYLYGMIIIMFKMEGKPAKCQQWLCLDNGLWVIFMFYFMLFGI